MPWKVQPTGGQLTTNVTAAVISEECAVVGQTSATKSAPKPINDLVAHLGDREDRLVAVLLSPLGSRRTIYEIRDT